MEYKREELIALMREMEKQIALCHIRPQLAGALADELEKDAVKIGSWKPYNDHFTKRQVGWICTNCSGVRMDLSGGDTEFCPHCGSLMDGEGVDG